MRRPGLGDVVMSLVRPLIESRLRWVEYELERIENGLKETQEEINSLRQAKQDFWAEKNELTDALETGKVSL